jgi:hypothetical protein
MLLKTASIHPQGHPPTWVIHQDVITLSRHSVIQDDLQTELVQTHKKTNSVAFSPQANYTD